MPESLPTGQPGFKRAGNRFLLFLGALWLMLALGGTWLLLAYANAPGDPGAPPSNWPASTLPAPREQPELILFLHPHCPCSRATIGELALLMTHCPDRVQAHVFFLRPVEMTEAWADTDLSRAAARIPGVTVHRDDAGREARLFGAETSGETLLYSPDGRLLFRGGITSARGHSGDNAGRSTLEALLDGQPVEKTKTQVFGCSLFECRLPATKSMNP